jgi:hypothetical protein
LFAFGLAGSVHPQGTHNLVRFVGRTLIALKHKIGADLANAPSRFGEGGGEGSRGSRIDGMGNLRFTFSAIYRCVSTGVEHPMGLMCEDSGATGLGIRQVEFPPACSDQLNARGDSDLELATELAFLTGE